MSIMRNLFYSSGAVVLLIGIIFMFNYSVVFFDYKPYIIERTLTNEGQKKGLSYVKDIKSGLLFSFKKEINAELQFKHTLYDLDILFLDNNKIIKKIAYSGAFQQDNIKCGKVRYLLELPAGTVKKYNLKVNSKLVFF